MTRRHIVLSALLATAALAAPSAAQAKQIDGLTVCGADGCQKVDRAIGQGLHELSGAALAKAPRAASHYRLVLKIGDGRQTFGRRRATPRRRPATPACSGGCSRSAGSPSSLCSGSWPGCAAGVSRSPAIDREVGT